MTRRCSPIGGRLDRRAGHVKNYATAFQVAGLFGLFRNGIVISFASTAKFAAIVVTISAEGKGVLETP